MTISHWKVADAQTVGRGHLKHQIPCQDYTISLQTAEMTVLVLADGAGSAPVSHIGAQAVANEMVRILLENFDDLFEEEDQLALRKRIIGTLLEELKIVKNFSGNCKDYASTLLYIAIRGDRYVAGHIGDGVIGAQRTSGEFDVLSNPENGLYANTTYFITSEEAWEYLRLYKGSTDQKSGFFLMSDGTAESLFNKQAQTFAPAIPRMMDWLRNHPNQKISEVLEKNLDSVIKQQTQDDCSLALASLATWNAEELMDTSPDYLADFVGVHCKITGDSPKSEMSPSQTNALRQEKLCKAGILGEAESKENDDKYKDKGSTALAGRGSTDFIATDEDEQKTENERNENVAVGTDKLSSTENAHSSKEQSVSNASECKPDPIEKPANEL